MAMSAEGVSNRKKEEEVQYLQYDPAIVDAQVRAETPAVLDKVRKSEKPPSRTAPVLKFCEPGHCGR